MKQLTQEIKNGNIEIQEFPWPKIADGQILVRNHYSVISSGTEGATAKTTRKSLIGKAIDRPDQVRKTLDLLRLQGPTQTYRAVTKKLNAYSPVGYSSAGEVLEVGRHVDGFSIGDRVACAGVGYANHAEVVCVPKNLCVKLSDDADLKFASYNSLGSIAMQGVRLADLKLGETCAVIGLGLIGQLTCLLLKASGVKIVGIDIDADAVSMAALNGVDLPLERNSPGIHDLIRRFTKGLGIDSTIITAASSSLDPVNFAGEIARKKGTVVIVGAVPTGFDRDPHYYNKELSLYMSCSYGPGRYDNNYEEKGFDYPPAYSRWTENRNMQAFQDLLLTGSIDISNLTTHEFTLDDASKAYDLITTKSEPSLGIVLSYGLEKLKKNERLILSKTTFDAKFSIGLIGAGSYAQSNLLPYFPQDDEDIALEGVMTTNGTTSKRIAKEFKFNFCTSIESDLLENKNINILFIATRHDTHADYVLKGINNNKNIFVEKPLCIKETDLEKIQKSLLHKPNTNLMVGFNRRFAPLALKLKEKIGEGPMSIIYRINAGQLPSDSWIQDLEIGGGRIIGEVCHFIDFLTFLCHSNPVKVYASTLPDPTNLQDTLNINLEFNNGSIGTINYFSNGAQSLPKEYIEVYKGGVTGILNDFKKLEVHSPKGIYKKRSFMQNKGQKEMLSAFFAAMKSSQTSPIPLNEILSVTQTTFKILDCLKTTLPQKIL